MDLHLTTIHIVKTERLTRKPVDEVNKAFVNPAHTRKFHLTKSTSR